MAKVWNIWVTIEEYDEETGEGKDIVDEQKLRMCNSQEEAEHFLLMMEASTCQ